MRRSVVGRLAAAILTVLGGAAHADGRQIAPDKAPAAWIEYAQEVSRQFQTALASDDPSAQRFAVFFDQWVEAAAGDSASVDPAVAGVSAHVLPALKVRVWLDGKGNVSRVEFAPFGNRQADADLKQLLEAQALGYPPPRGMRQPLVVRLSPGAQL